MNETIPPRARAAKALRLRYNVLRALCFVTWGANVIYMIFGIIFVKELGVSLSSIFLLNILVMVVSFITSVLLNRASDRVKKRKAFMLLAYALRTAGILVLALATDVVFYVIYLVLSSLLNPLSFDVAIVYEIGEKLSRLDQDEMRQHSRADFFRNEPTRYYLKYRAMGSLGWACMAPVAGFFIGHVNENPAPWNLFFSSLVGYRTFILMAFIIYLVSMLVFAAVYEDEVEIIGKSRGGGNGGDDARLMRKHVQSGRDEEGVVDPGSHPGNFPGSCPGAVNPGEGGGEGGKVSRFASIGSLGLPFILLLSSMFLYQAGATLFQTPYGIFLKEFSRGNLFLVGISYFCSAIPEVPLFMVAYRLIARKGYQITLVLSFLMEITRVFATIAVIPVGMPVLVVPLQFMNSFSLRWPAVSHGISQELSPGARATGMNLNLFLEKAGGMLGNAMGTIISQIGIDPIGTYANLFTGSLVFVSLATVVFAVGNARHRRR